MKSHNFISIATGIIGCTCIFAAGFIFALTKPFDTSVVPTVLQPTPVASSAIMEDSKALKEAKAIDVHNYDTALGDKDVSETDIELCTAFTDKYFNIGYRSIVASQDSYVQNAVATFPNGRIEHGKYYFSSTQFADFIANIVGGAQIQMQGKFTPSAWFEKDNIAYINGQIELTLFAGSDTSALAEFFGLSDMELNTPYSLPVTFKISRTTGEIVGFSPVETPVP